MSFTIGASIPALTVFIQGLLSFFSPCVLPLVPLYIGYLAGTSDINPQAEDRGRRSRVFINTVFFVLGISVTFFLLGFGFTALGQFFHDNRIWFARIGGIIMILFGLYQLGLFGNSNMLERERRFHVPMQNIVMGPLPALLLGFTFSFSWTPCVGPTLTSVLLLAGSSGQGGTAAFLIGIYTAGFIIPFLLVGLFSDSLLQFLGRHGNVVKYTTKAGAILLILMGIMTLTGFMNHITEYISDAPSQTPGYTQESDASKGSPDSDSESSEGESPSAEAAAAPDIQLTDQYGALHQLSDYKGKTVFLNFWATWCGPCRSEMGEIQELYEELGYNEDDVVILAVAAPNLGSEGSEEEIQAFLRDEGYTYPVLMDHGGAWFSAYGIRVYPTTFFITPEGSVFGHIEGAMTKDIMESAIRQTAGQAD